MTIDITKISVRYLNAIRAFGRAILAFVLGDAVRGVL